MIPETPSAVWLKSTTGTLVNLNHVSNIRRVSEKLTPAGEEKKYYVIAHSNAYVDHQGQDRADETILCQGSLPVVEGYLKRLEVMLNTKEVAPQ